MLRLEFSAQTGMFGEALLQAYQILRVSLQLNDYVHILQMFTIISNLVMKADPS